MQVEAKEVEPLVPARQAGDPGLVWVQLQPQTGKISLTRWRACSARARLVHSTMRRVAGGNRTPRLSQNRT